MRLSNEIKYKFSNSYPVSRIPVPATLSNPALNSPNVGGTVPVAIS